MFEQFTSDLLRPDPAGPKPTMTDEEAMVTLATIWKKALYGFYRVDDMPADPTVLREGRA